MARLALPALALPALLAACSPAGMVVGAGATVGSAAVQERGLEQAAQDNLVALRINRLWLESDPALFERLETQVVEGRVVLTGRVPKPEDRVEAVRLAWQAEGVRSIADEIAVDDESGLLDKARDEVITTRLRGRILLDREIRSVNYAIDTVNGTVYLSGIAQDRRELDRVVAHARDIPRVRSIVPHVRVMGAEAGT